MLDGTACWQLASHAAQLPEASPGKPADGLRLFPADICRLSRAVPGAPGALVRSFGSSCRHGLCIKAPEGVLLVSAAHMAKMRSKRVGVKDTLQQKPGVSSAPFKASNERLLSAVYFRHTACNR